MAIQLDEERTNYPAIKFENPGDYINVACIRIETLPLLAYGTEQPVMGKDGKPRSQTRLTGIVTGGNGQIKDGEALRPAAKGDIVSLYIKGLSRWEFFQAKTKLAPAKFEVGDLLQWRYTGTQPGQVTGTTKKVYTITLGKPKPADAARTAECEAHYMRLIGEALAPTHEATPHDPDSYDPFASDDD